MDDTPPRIRPAPGQESVWDYPRPPALERVEARLRVVFGGYTIADTARGWRVMETSHPPVYYFPPSAIDPEVLSPASGITTCEYKGIAAYWNAALGKRSVGRAAWSYPDPSEGFEPIRDHVAFYASKMDACFVGAEQARPQEGDFYGGWITSKIIGPFKGPPGTKGW